MKVLKITFAFIFLSAVCLAQANSGSFLQFKARIGFDDEKERIAAKYFSADGTKVTFIGLKTIQTWDIAAAKLVESHPHEIVELDKFYGTYYQISPDQSKVITLDSIGRGGGKKVDRVNAYAYDIATGKRIAVLERPDYSVRFAQWSADGETLVTFSGLFIQKQTEISFWNGADLSFRKSVIIEGYTWHYLSPDGERLYVGNGGQVKVLGLSVGASNGDVIRVYNTRTGEIEKELKANGESFDIDNTVTRVSSDGRFIATSKHKNIIVWDTAAATAQPIYELAPRDPKGKIFFEGLSGDGKYLFAEQQKTDEYYDAATGKLVTSVVPKLARLRRENRYLVQKDYTFLDSFSEMRFREENSVLPTPDGRYAVTIPCEEATVVDLMTEQNLYTVKSGCVSSGSDENYVGDRYYYSYDVFRLSPNGKLLINFRFDKFTVRDLKSGAILQTIERKKDLNLMEVPKWTNEWDIKGRYALTIAEDRKSMLIWEINEN